MLQKVFCVPSLGFPTFKDLVEVNQHLAEGWVFTVMATTRDTAFIILSNMNTPGEGDEDEEEEIKEGEATRGKKPPRTGLGD